MFGSRFARGVVPLLAPLAVLVALIVIVLRVDTNAVGAITGPGRLDTLVVEEALVPKTVRASLVSSGRRSATLRTAPGTAGTVTAVSIEAGSTIRTGAPLFEVNGRTVLAAATERPFYRPIGPGASGPDVEMLGQLLSRLGLVDPSVVGRQAGWELVQGIDRFWRQLGDDPGQNYQFEPSWLVWIPVDEMVVADSVLEVGMPVPEIIGAAVGAHAAARVMLSDGSELPRDDWSRYRVQQFNGAAVPGMEPPLEDVVGDPGRYLESAMGAGGSAPDAGGPRATGGVQVESTQEASYSLVLQLPETVEGAVVPLTALLGVPGRQCVVVVEEGRRETRAVDALGEANGRPVVEGISPGDRILVSPDPRVFRCSG